MTKEYGEYVNYVSDNRVKPSEINSDYNYYVPYILPMTVFEAIIGDLYKIQGKLVEPMSTLEVMNDIDDLIAKLKY